MKNILEFTIVSIISIVITFFLWVLSYLFTVFMSESIQTFWYPIILGLTIFSFYCYKKGYRIDRSILDSRQHIVLIIILASLVYLLANGFLVQQDWFGMEIYWIPLLFTFEFVYFFLLKLNKGVEASSETSKVVRSSFLALFSFLIIFFVMGIFFTYLIYKSW